jgi:hypothetical protein
MSASPDESEDNGMPSSSDNAAGSSSSDDEGQRMRSSSSPQSSSSSDDGAHGADAAVTGANADPTVLQLFWDLASLDPVSRCHAGRRYDRRRRRRQPARA